VAARDAGAVHRDGFGGRCRRSPSDPKRGPPRRSDQQAGRGIPLYCGGSPLRPTGPPGDEDDLTSIIAGSELRRRARTAGMAISFMHTFVNAGETHQGVLGFVGGALAEHPDSAGWWPSSRPGGQRDSKELRYYPLQLVRVQAPPPRRGAGRATHPQGTTTVLMAYASANVTRMSGDRPDEFDVTTVLRQGPPVVRLRRALLSGRGCSCGPTPGILSSNGCGPRFPDLGAERSEPPRWAEPILQGLGTVPVKFTRERT